jgi:flagella basal body P-ring formation protein FlgA
MNRLRYILVVVLFLVVAFWASGAEGAVAQVRLASEVELAVGAVTLGMIAEVSASDSQLEKRLGNLVVGQVHEGTTQSSLGVYEINRSLALAHIVPGSVDIYGGRTCRIAIFRSGIVEDVEEKTPAEEIVAEVAKEFETVRDKLVELVVLQSGLDGSRLKIQWRSGKKASVLDRAFSAQRYRIKPRSTLGPGRVTIEVIDREGKGPGEPKTFRVKGQVSYLCESVVTTRSLKPGDVIGVNDVKLLSRRVQTLRDLGIEEVALVIDQEVARSIPMNMVVFPDMIKKVELVHRRDVVRVQYNDGRIAVSLRARAEQSGCLGDVIKVYDLFSDRHFQGRVVGVGEVAVLHGGM